MKRYLISGNYLSSLIICTRIFTFEGRMSVFIDAISYKAQLSNRSMGYSTTR